MAKKRKPKKESDDVLDIIKLGTKATIGIGLLGAVSNAVKK